MGTFDLIRRAKADARVKVLVIRPVGSGALWAQLQEVHAAIEDFKRPDRIVVGVDSERAREVLYQIYRPLSLNASLAMG